MSRETFDLGTHGSVEVELVYVITDTQLREAYAWLKAQKELGYDIETSGLNPRTDHIATLQFGNPMADDPRVYVIDVRCVSRDALDPILDILEDPKVCKLGQNLKFEAKWTLHHYGRSLKRLNDNMIIEQVCRAGLLEVASWRMEPANKSTTQQTMELKDRKRVKVKGKKGKGGGGERAVYRPVSMDQLAQRYLGVVLDKDTALRTGFYKTPPGQHSRRQQRYAGGDVVYPFYIRQAQRRLVKERGVSEILRIEHALVPILAATELRGIELDVDAWLQLEGAAVAEYAAAQSQLDQLVQFLNPVHDLFSNARPTNPWTGKPWNWDSPAQVRDAIIAYCEHIKWPFPIAHTEEAIRALKLRFGTGWLEHRNDKERTQAKLEGRKPKLITAIMIPEWLIPDKFVVLPDTDGKRLEVLYVREKLPRELIGPLMVLSKASQRVSNYGKGMLKKNLSVEDSSLRYEIHQLAAATGRFSMQPNLQSIPRDSAYRACFVPRAGYQYCIADLSQIEPRLLAQVSGDPTYTETYKLGKDLYVAVGERMYSVTIDKHTEEGKDLRQRSKVSVLALAYLMGPAKYRNEFTRALRKQIEEGKATDLSLAEATASRDLFFAACPGIRPYQDDAIAQTTFGGPECNLLYDDLLGENVTYIKAPCGRIRLWAEEQNPYAEPVNHPIQGASATGIKLAMVLMQACIESKGWDAHILLSIHDELIVEARTNIAKEAAAALKHCMESAFASICPDIPVVAEFPEKSDAGVCARWIK